MEPIRQSKQCLVNYNYPMKNPAVLIATASLFVGNALGACTGMNAADEGKCPTQQCKSLGFDFSDSDVLTSLSSHGNGSTNANFISQQTPDFASISTGKLVLSLKNSGTTGGKFSGSTVYFTNWIHYGTVTALIRSGATEPGVVSSLQLQDDAGSSIDMDWVGASSNRVQANYYTYNQLMLSQAAAPVLPMDPTSSFVEYKIVWLPGSLTWYVNGMAIRTVNKRSTFEVGAQRYHYPDKPARLSFSIWNAADSINPGATSSWAGKLKDYPPNTHFDMEIDSVSINCFTNSSTHVSHLGTDAPTGPLKDASVPSSSKDSQEPDGSLENFGIGAAAGSSASKHSNSGIATGTITTSSDPGPVDDVSKWLAGLRQTTSSAPFPVSWFGRITPTIFTVVSIAMAYF